MLVKRCLGSRRSAFKIIIVKGWVDDFVAVVLQIARLDATRSRVPAVEKKDLHTNSGARVGLPESALPCPALSQHVAKQSALFNGIVKGDMRMRQGIEPAFGHIALGAGTVIGLHDGHGKGLHIQRRMTEGTLSDKVHQVPIHKQKIKTCWIGDKNALSWQGFQPVAISATIVKLRRGMPPLPSRCLIGRLFPAKLKQPFRYLRRFPRLLFLNVGNDGDLNV